MNNPSMYGRNGDSMLVHMRPDEVQALGLLAQSVGSNLTTNPQTGLPEAWALPSWVLPVAAIAATALTAGAAAPAAAGALGAAGAGTAAGAAGTAGALGAGAAGAGAAGAAGSGLLGAAGAAGAGATGGGLLGGSLVGSGALDGAAAAGSSALGSSTLAAGGADAIGGSALGGSAVGSGALADTGASSGLLGGTQAAAPVVNMSSNAGLLDKANYAMGNTFSQGGTGANALDTLDKYGKPLNTAMTAANNANQMANQNQPVVPPPQPRQPVPLDLSGILKQSSDMQSNDMAEQMRKRQMMQQLIQNIGRV